MSYTKSFKKTITVSGTEHVHYPSSEHGGSMDVHYSETVPVEIKISVNTQAFDESVTLTNGSIGNLTAAMKDMDIAQCAAIDESSKKISMAIVDGFFKVVNSDISMQKAENNTTVKAKFALLMQLSKEMTSKHDRMVDDVSRLYKHYSDLFRGMDEDLEKRIKELDKNAFYLANYVHNELLTAPMKLPAASSADQLNKTNNTNALVESARIKNKTSHVFENLTDSILKSEDYQGLISNMLNNEEINKPQVECVPVVYCKKADLQLQQYKTNVYAPECNCKETLENSINNYVCTQEDAKWKKCDDKDLEMLDQSFRSMVEESASNSNHLDEQVYQEIMQLWQQNKDKMKQL